MTTYEEFLRAKSFRHSASGISADDVIYHPAMKPMQKDVLRWALQMGKAAAFLGTGLGKTLIELQWAENVHAATGMPVLISAPLAVAHQIVREAEKFGFAPGFAYSTGKASRITITNYERLESFNPGDFGGIALDESSILKATDGRTRTRIIEMFGATPYKLPSSATPAPNDFMELGNHAEFLGVMTQSEMLSMFFVHDGGETQKWRLKGHARKEFWRWVASWAVMIQKPSDIGYDDAEYVLPPLRVHHHTIQVDKPSEGMLFAMPAETLGERIAARRSTADDRVMAAADLVNATADQWVIWANLNAEADLAEKTVRGAEQVAGADKDDDKVDRALRFASGDLNRIISKCSIFGHGLNWQHCHKMAFIGVTDSFEQYFQAVRRCWRFGQTEPVHVHIFSASTEGNVIENLRRKEADAERMAGEMREAMAELSRTNLRGIERSIATYTENKMEGASWSMLQGDCVDMMKSIPNASIDYSIYSPPFASLYTYSNSDRDMGNSKTHEEFWDHYKFLIAEHWRTHKPGRLISIHCMNLPTSKVRDGFIGIRDFRGEIIRAFEDAGFIYHSEVCIWKDPVTAMQRTKALGLLHKTIRKDSAMSRQGIPDYLVTFRKPGDNPEPIAHAEDFPVQLWQQYASPIWMDINPSDTLQYRSAREHDDERHICPLQLEVIRRALKLWSNPGDVVLSPFAGIGSEGYVALQFGRKYLGIELKESYWRQSCRNIAAAESGQVGMFADATEDAEVVTEDSW